MTLHRSILRLAVIVSVVALLLAVGSARPLGSGIGSAESPRATSVPKPSAWTGGPVTSPSTPMSTDRHVAADGSDDADGSAAHPWATIAHAVEAIEPGRTIRVGPGTFAGAEIDRPGLAVVGTSRRTVVSGGLIVRADGVRLEGLAVGGRDQAYQGGITVRDARDVTIVGNSVSGNSFGVYLIDALGAHVAGNQISDNAYGIEIHGRTDGVVIEGNRIADNDRPLDDARAAGGLNLYLTSGPVLVRDNDFADNDEVGIEIYGASNVEIRGNRFSGSSDMIETGTEDGRPCDDLRIHRNVFYNDAIGDDSEERGIYLRCASRSVVERNTFDGLDRFAIGLYAGEGGFNGPLEDLSIRHNILAWGRAFSVDSAMPGSVTIDANVLFPCKVGDCPILGHQVAFVAGHGGTERFATFRAWTGFEASGLVSDPQFVDRGGRDYRVAAGSPASGLAGAFDDGS